MIAEKVIEISGRLLGEDTVTKESNYYDDLGGDSLDIITLIIECESAFYISIDDAAVDDVKTVKDMIDVVTEKVGL